MSRTKTKDKKTNRAKLYKEYKSNLRTIKEKRKEARKIIAELPEPRILAVTGFENAIPKTTTIKKMDALLASIKKHSESDLVKRQRKEQKDVE